MHHSTLEQAKRAAAYAAGKRHVKSGCRIGVGSGTTAKFFVEFLAEKVNDGTVEDIICVPSSFSTRKWLTDSGLQVNGLEDILELDLCIDGADEVDFNLNCIKGNSFGSIIFAEYCFFAWRLQFCTVTNCVMHIHSIEMELLRWWWMLNSRKNCASKFQKVLYYR